MPDNSYDIIIIGAGPAGCTAGAILAEQGHRVLILEKETFPRYIVGESLLPFCYFTLKRLGLIEKLNASGFTKKYSVQFVGQSGNVSQPFYFSEHFDHESSRTWQVLRSDFDKMLLDNAREKGAEIREGITVKSLIQEEERVAGVMAEDSDERSILFNGKMTIDASGRNTFSAVRQGWRQRDTQLKKMAIWTYYQGAMRDPGLDEGATTVAYLPEKGWFWYIPLLDDWVSVGIVAERDYLYRHGDQASEIFAAEISNNKWITDHLEPGCCSGKFRVTGDYSYRSRYCAAEGLVLAGDAFAFLDPVFSSGVFLALKSGELAADAIHQALQVGDLSADRFTEYGRTLCYFIESMRKLVYAFYDPEFRFSMLLEKYPHLRGLLTDCLIGNLAQDFDRLFEAIGEFASIPEPLDYGLPLSVA